MNADRYPGLQVGDATPWGRADQVERISDGIWCADTPSHGGVWVAPALFETMPDALRTNVYGGRNWFEEDCEWALVALAFPDSFAGSKLRAAIQSIAYYEKGGQYMRAALWLANTPRGRLLLRRADPANEAAAIVEVPA